MVTTPDAETEYPLKSFEVAIFGLVALKVSQIFSFSAWAKLVVSLTNVAVVTSVIGLRMPSFCGKTWIRSVRVTDCLAVLVTTKETL